MKRYALLLLALVLTTAGLIWGVASRTPAPAAIPPSFVRLPAKGTENAAIATPPQVATTPPDGSKAAIEGGGSPIPLILDVEKAKDRVRRLSATFDEAYVAELARYLRHPSAEVRGQALEGLVMLGDASAIPLIRSAAELADKNPATSAEAITLRDAAKVLAETQRAGEPKMPKLPLAKGSETSISSPIAVADAAPTATPAH